MSVVDLEGLAMVELVLMGWLVLLIVATIGMLLLLIVLVILLANFLTLHSRHSLLWSLVTHMVRVFKLRLRELDLNGRCHSRILEE